MNPASQPVLQLRDIHLPAEPGWWPPAPGWWVVAALLLALLAWTARIALRHYRLHKQRQHILAMLDTLTQRPDDASPQAIAEISTLLRRLALMRYPRQQVAALTGADWLQFLDRSGGEGRFSQGPGQVLATGPYQPNPPTDLDIAALSALVREWVKKNTDRQK